MLDITEQLKENQAAQAAFEGTAVPPRMWQIEGPDAQGTHIVRQYIQGELSFFEVQTFTNIGMSYVEKFISGELGSSLKEIFSGDLRQQIQMPQMSEMTADKAESMIEENTDTILGIIKAVQAIPQLEMDIMLLALGVPKGERDWAAAIMRGPIARGGLTRGQGFDLLMTFVKQNTQAVRDFFSEQGAEFVKEARVEIFGEEPGGEDQGPEEDRVEPPTAEEETTVPAEPAATPGGTPLSTSAPTIQASE